MTNVKATTPPLRVVHVIGASSVQSGSFERHLQSVARHARARGIELELVYPDALPHGQHAAALAALGVRVHIVPAASHTDIRAARRLSPIVRAADLVHGHFAPACDIGAGVAALHRKPFLLTRHFLAANGPRSLHGLLTRIEGRLATRTVAVSDAVADSLETMGVGRARISVVPLGVDRERFIPPSPEQRRDARLRLGLDDDVKVVVSTSHHRSGKGVEVLVEAAMLPGRWLALVAGDGPMRHQLERRAAGSGGRVRFLGRVDDVGSLLHAADAFCLPTVDYPEGLPMAVLEALAVGLPLVTTPVPGLLPVVAAAGDAARVVEAGDAVALAAGIDDVLARSGLMAKARSATSPFDLEATSLALVDLYETILRSGAALAAA